MTQNKTIKGLGALALSAIVTSFSHAAFTSVDKKTFSAGATLTGSGSVSMTTAVKDRLTNAPATSLTWGTNGPAPAPGAGFLLADQYIQLNTNITTSNPGGVQIYTDNTNAAASPRFTGDKTQTTPAGLISTADTTKKLPTAWSATSTTSTVAATPTSPTAPVAADPNSKTPASFAWLFHEDIAQVAIPSQNAAAFQPGADYVTTYKNGAGVHFGQDPKEFGGFKNADVNYIYTEADFTSATTPNTYGTNELILEAYTL